jgi:hypothetical protein
MNWPWQRRSVPTEHQAPAKGIKGATIRLSADDGKFRHASELTQEISQHREFSELYENTIAGSIINTEVDDLFAQGWALQGEDADDVAKVREYLTAVSFEIEVKKLAIESKIYGFGLAEIGTVGQRHALVAHSSYNIYPVMDPDGWLDGFVQMGKNQNVVTEWTKREVITLALRPYAGTPETGRSELAPAYKSIVDYENIREANTAMILRMGYPSYDITFEGDDGIVPADLLEGELADLGPGSTMANGLGAKINTLNAQGVTQVATYAETALQAVAVAMQIPRAMAGLSDNSEATAKVTLSKYYNRIAAEQLIVAQTMQSLYLDRYVLPDLGIKAGTVQLIFNSPDPDSQLKKAQLLQAITSLDPTDPEYLLSVEEQAEIWGKHPKSGEYDTAKMRDELIDRVMHHIAEAQGSEGKEAAE